MVIKMRYLSQEEFDLKMKKIRLSNQQAELRNKLRAERKKFIPVKKMKTSNIVLTFSIVAIVLFTIACLFIQYRIGTEVSSTLITLWFSFWTVEIVALTGIKISKVVKNRDSSPNVDCINEKYEEFVEANDIDSVG